MSEIDDYAKWAARLLPEGFFIKHGTSIPYSGCVAYRNINGVHRSDRFPHAALLEFERLRGEELKASVRSLLDHEA